MLTKRESSLSILMIFIQIIITVITFLIPRLFFNYTVFSIPQCLFFQFQIIFIWGVLLTKFRLGVIFRANNFNGMFRGYFVTILIGTIFLWMEIITLPFFHEIRPSLLYVSYFAILNLISLLTFKLGFYYIMRFIRSTGLNSRNVVLIVDESTISFVDVFSKAKDWGYKLDSVISYDESLKEICPTIRIIKKDETLSKYLTVQPVDDVFYCLPVVNSYYDLDKFIQDCNEIGINSHIMEPSFVSKLSKFKNLRFDSSFTTNQTTSTKYLSLKLKDILDTLFSSAVLAILSPFIVIIALIIKLQDGGTIFFKQERIGLNGRKFICYKFRSMVPNAEELRHELESQNESDGPTFKIEKDPRITKIGRILRKTSIDELPQFYNVIRGEMSVVGPRPPLLSEVKKYERYQIRRLSMKPGITCIWQVYGRNSVSFEEWMKMDLEYIDNWSLKLDLKLIIHTVAVVFKANGR